MLQANNLSCRRGERCLWENLQLNLTPGELLQVTGANGCGKTSLLRILTGLARAHAGEVYWQGAPISQQQDYQQQVYFLGHQPAVKNELTVRENLQFFLSTTAKKSWMPALEKVGLGAHSEHFGYQLSQGQKQRVALARLLLNDARLWILDEPFAGLDHEMIENLQTIFTDYLRQGGMIVLSTHRSLTLAALTPHTLQLNLS